MTRRQDNSLKPLESQETSAKPILTAGAGLRWAALGIAALLSMLILLLLLGLNMRRGLNHDEHQFVTAGILIARDGLLPYVDFNYFHVPLLAFVYALLYQVSAELLFAARLFSIFCSWLGLGLLFFAALRRATFSRVRWRLMFALGSVLLLLSMPLFTYTSGRAWNHDLPILLTLLAFFIHVEILLRGRSSGWLAAGGLLMGLATITRLSFAFTAMPFLLVIWLMPGLPAQRRRNGSLAFLGGALLGTLPAWLMFFMAPQAFLFGNLGYVGLNTAYYTGVQELAGANAEQAMTLVGKLSHLGRILIEPGSLVLLLLLAISVVPVVKYIRFPAPGRGAAAEDKNRRDSQMRLTFALLLVLFSLLGALGATPSQRQYFYVLFPFLILAVIYAFALWPGKTRRWVPWIWGAGLVIAIATAIPTYSPGLEIVFSAAEWYPKKVHARGRLLAELVGAGKVLTLAPIFPLEGAAPIYPEFATGPFAWRVAPLVPVQQRHKLGLVGEEELPQLLAADPPAGILVDLDNDDRGEEAALIQYAEENDYVPVPMPDEGLVWLAPQATWRDAIILGGYTMPRQQVAPGERFVVTLYLMARTPVEQNLNVLVRAVGADGQELLRDEGWPWGAATSTWQPGELWPDGHEFRVPPDAAPDIYRVEVAFYDPETLDPFGETATIGYLPVAGPATAPSQEQLPPVAQFGDRVQLLSASVDPEQVQAGGDLPVRLLWRASAPLTESYTVFVHLVGPDGAMVAQRDSLPRDGFYPTQFWQPGLEVDDETILSLPAELAAGVYTVHVGLYDSASLERLSVLRDGDVSADSYPFPLVVE